MRLLVVEDESKVASFLKQGLEEAGHVVDLARTGADGEYLASLNSYDVLVFDCMLPDKDGRQSCRDLRSKGNTTPVLLLTARDSSADKIIGFDSGADQYITKPFDFDVLLASIRALGRRPLPSRLRSLGVADLELDPASRSVHRAGEEIHVTAKEYLLLELLVRRAGKVLSRTEIMERIWDMHHDPATNTVDVLIKHLRDKIDRDFEPKLIQTIRGVGYTIRAETMK